MPLSACGQNAHSPRGADLEYVCIYYLSGHFDRREEVARGLQAARPPNAAEKSSYADASAVGGSPFGYPYADTSHIFADEDFSAA